MQTALFISSYLESEEQSVKYQTDPNFRGSTLHYPEPVVKTFRRWTDTLRQVPMSIISLCWDARVCCRCKPTCQGPGSHRKSPRTADQSLSDDGLKRHFQEDGQRGSAFQRRAVDCENTERPSDNGSIKVALAVVRRQLRRDQGGSGWTMWIYTQKKHLVIFRTRRDVAEGCSWWNLGTKAAEWEKSNTGHRWQTLSQCRLSFISHFWIVISSLCFFFFSLLEPGGGILIKSHWWRRNARFMLFCISYLFDVFISSGSLCFFLYFLISLLLIFFRRAKRFIWRLKTGSARDR